MMTSFRLACTKSFSVIELAPAEVGNIRNEIIEDTGEVCLDDGDDFPLGDSAVAILLEQLNLAPKRTPVAVLESVALPPPLEPVILEQDRGISVVGQGGTGGVLWPAALACAHFLVHLRSGAESAMSPHIVIELGAGTGLAGLATARLLGSQDLSSQGSRTRVVLTDQRNVLPNLERNVGRNSAPRRSSGSPGPSDEVSLPGGACWHDYGASCSVGAMAVDWNLGRDRESLLTLLASCRASAAAQFSAADEAAVETLVLCSDLVFGNR